ncbi:LLM class flavin-dependent oxidoreductase [Rhizomonospora bruguierae]|uniref:LLM class flavin-dependent oxidoreductase n=1 Tax=Rhizomonospora bruguierae TaxID=1581705 RepID=UPI001BCB6EB6|nr:LLM class flavin-dependent oxidoreductase [Micromonospora sp. NBRC 107566]
MRLGMMMPTKDDDGGSLRSESLADAARRLEEAGFDGIWANDSIGRPYASVDPLTVLSVAAAVTARPVLGTCVLQVPLRSPVDLAHRVMSTQLVCGGRFALGVGAGSTAADFAACGVDFEERFTLLDHGLEILDRVYAGGPPRIVGWDSTRERPPVLLGAWGGRRGIKRAATEFDGWIGSAKKGRPLVEVLARFRAAGGRRAVLTTIETDLDVVGDDGDDGFTLRCSPRKAADRLARLADLGFDDAVLRSPRTDARTLATLRNLLP